MNYQQFRTLYKKEIMDVIRDKKTVLTMIVLPLILYPLIFLVAMQIISMINTSQEEHTYRIAYEQVEDADRQALNDWISSDEDDLDYIIKEVESDDPDGDLNAEEIDAYITTSVTENQITYEIHYLSTVDNSSLVVEMLEKEIDSLAKKKAEDNVKAEGLDVNKMLYPVVTDSLDQSSDESAMGNLLGSILPFFLIMGIVMGCLYPAIDTTAGEKERGTLETLLTLPIGNLELIISKFMSVATMAIVSVVVNLISMGGVMVYLFKVMGSMSEDSGEFNVGSFVPAMLVSIVCMIAFALFMSAVVMCICAFAKSFKEANNYVTPVTVVVMLTGYIGFIPNIELSTKTAVLPVANVCLLMKALLVFKYNISLIVLALLSNIIYAFIAVWVLAKIYNSESILFGESASGIKFFERRQNIKQGGLPTIQEGLLIWVVALLMMVYVGGIAGLSNPKMSILVPQAFIIGLPIAACIYMKGDMKRIYSLKSPRVSHVAGSLLLIVGAFGVNILLSGVLQKLLPDSGSKVNEEFDTMLDGVPFIGALLLIALLPAVCEELMFRGYLFTAFRRKMSITGSILLVSLLFAITHMSMIKLLTTALLGVALGYAVYCSDSIFCSILMHFLNNAVAVFIEYYGDRISIPEVTTGVCVVVGVVSIGLAAAGIAILKKGRVSRLEVEQ